MTSFVTTPPAPPDKRDAATRAQDFAEIYESFPLAGVQASRCAQCGVPFCQSGCPLQNHIPDWLRLAAEGDYGRAQDTVDVVQGGPEPAMSLAFNARHVLDALGPIEGEAELLFSGSTSPAIFRASGGGGYMAVIVTLRV